MLLSRNPAGETGTEASTHSLQSMESVARQDLAAVLFKGGNLVPFVLLEESVIVMYQRFCCILGEAFSSLWCHDENANIFCSVRIF